MMEIYKILLLIDVSVLMHKAILFRGYAYFCPLAFTNQIWHRNSDIINMVITLLSSICEKFFI